MSRCGFKINNSSYEYSRGERVNWLDAFADNYAKTEGESAVDVARKRSQMSVHDQISAIVGNSGHTVESKVKEMQERMGLTEYLKRMASEKDDSVKVVVFAQFGLKMCDDIINFCKNKISSHRGQIAIPALQHDLLQMFKQHGVREQDVDNDDVANYLNKLIVSELQLHPAEHTGNEQLGKEETDMTEDGAVDFFKGLTPTT
jgi:hypothetical protein